MHESLKGKHVETWTFEYEGGQLKNIPELHSLGNLRPQILKEMVVRLERYRKQIEHPTVKKRIKIRRVLDTNLSYIYLMIDEKTGHHKIGKSKKPNSREKTLQSEAPQINMVFTSPMTNALHEGKLHQIFKSKRIRGEWFNLNDKDLDFIKKYDFVIC